MSGLITPHNMRERLGHGGVRTACEGGLRGAAPLEVAEVLVGKGQEREVLRALEARLRGNAERPKAIGVIVFWSNTLQLSTVASSGALPIVRRNRPAPRGAIPARPLRRRVLRQQCQGPEEGKAGPGGEARRRQFVTAHADGLITQRGRHATPRATRVYCRDYKGPDAREADPAAICDAEAVGKALVALQGHCGARTRSPPHDCMHVSESACKFAFIKTTAALEHLGSRGRAGVIEGTWVGENASASPSSSRCVDLRSSPGDRCSSSPRGEAGAKKGRGGEGECEARTAEGAFGVRDFGQG